jgi:uroporphyrinogen III methyltransferase/synthase
MQRVLITRPRAQADDFANPLREAGFEPILFPVIEIRAVENNSELEQAIGNLQKYAWVIFTSVNAVEAGLASAVLQAQGIKGQPPLRVAAVGRKTADALRRHGIEPDFIPDEFVGVNIMPGLGDVNGRRILLPRAERASRELPEAIRQVGGVAHEIVTYRTLPAEVDLEGFAALKAGVDFVTFTSPSTVENFIEVTRRIYLDPFHLPNNPIIACIGTVTEKAAREAGFKNVITAKEFTTEGLVSLLAASRSVK